MRQLSYKNFIILFGAFSALLFPSINPKVKMSPHREEGVIRKKVKKGGVDKIR